jgi:hypothetical protein
MTPRRAALCADDAVASHRAADGAGPSIEGARTCAHGTSTGAVVRFPAYRSAIQREAESKEVCSPHHPASRRAYGLRSGADKHVSKFFLAPDLLQAGSRTGESAGRKGGRRQIESLNPRGLFFAFRGSGSPGAARRRVAAALVAVGRRLAAPRPRPLFSSPTPLPSLPGGCVVPCLAGGRGGARRVVGRGARCCGFLAGRSQCCRSAWQC